MISEKHSILVLGGGHHGYKAAQALIGRYGADRLVVVDHDRQKAPCFDKMGIRFVCDDGIAFLTNAVGPDRSAVIPRWIVASIPRHVAFEWLMAQIKKRVSARPSPLSPDLPGKLPNPMPGQGGHTLYTSHARFFCPDACPEPAAFCTHTGQPRPQNLFELIAGLDAKDRPVISLRSYQLAPGVGALRSRDLQEACKQVMRKNAARFIVGTACRCHGVVDQFDIDR